MCEDCKTGDPIIISEGNYGMCYLCGREFYSPYQTFEIAVSDAKYFREIAKRELFSIQSFYIDVNLLVARLKRKKSKEEALNGALVLQHLLRQHYHDFSKKLEMIFDKRNYIKE